MQSSTADSDGCICSDLAQNPNRYNRGLRIIIGSA